MRPPFVLLLGVGLSFAGCANVLGLERAELDPQLLAGDELPSGALRSDAGSSDAGSSDAGSSDDSERDAATADDARAAPVVPSCEQYCETVMAACTSDGNERHAVYDSLTSCLVHCQQFPEGQPGQMRGNSLSCRYAHATIALAFAGERQFECPAAGPGGNGVCGSNCDGYCTLMAGLCPDVLAGDCQQSCEAVPDRGGYDISQIDGNSLQCRFYHLGAATLSPEFHCLHAAGEQPCADGE